MFKVLCLGSLLFLSSCSLFDEDEEVQQCSYGDAKYEVGEIFNDGCNDCTCESDGMVVCTEMACVDE